MIQNLCEGFIVARCFNLVFPLSTHRGGKVDIKIRPAAVMKKMVVVDAVQWMTTAVCTLFR